MATDDVPKIVQVPVKRYDVNLTLEDILTPLTQLSAHRAQQRAASVQSSEAVQSSEMDQHLQQLSDLARQLKDVISRINEADPTVLAPTTQGQPPGT
jgi:hypothetical protein